MKIAFICHDANLTGAPKVGFEIARCFSRNNEVIMITKKDGSLLSTPEYRSAFYRVLNSNTSHEVSRFKLPERISIAKEIMQREKPDLLYVNSVASSDWCAAGKECNIPVVLHSHEMKNELLSLESIKIFERDLPRYVDLLVTVSGDAERDIIEQCSLPFKKILSLKEGINFQKVWELSRAGDFVQPKNIFAVLFYISGGLKLANTNVMSLVLEEHIFESQTAYSLAIYHFHNGQWGLIPAPTFVEQVSPKLLD